LCKLLSEHLAFQPVTVPFDVDDPAVVEQAVEDRRSNNLVTEQLLPVDKALIRRDDGRGLLMPGRYEVEGETPRRLSFLSAILPPDLLFVSGEQTVYGRISPIMVCFASGSS
jgi:hypothetical protein